MGIRIALIGVFLAASARPSAACASKSNELIVVLGMAAGEPVTVHVTLAEADDQMNPGATEWDGAATLHIGTQRTLIGAIDPTRDAGSEVSRLIASARKLAEQQTTLVQATLVSTQACRARSCDGVSLDKTDTKLRAGSVTLPLPAAEPDTVRKLVAVTRYTAGTKTILVANVGSGDARWAKSLRACDGTQCRDVVTLHHGAQGDFVLVK